MGIDIYARWKGQTEAEEVAQFKVGFDGTQGRVGYLREAYHGSPYATRHLCAEAFAFEDGAFIQAAVLKERLAHTLDLAEERERKIYTSDAREIEAVKQSYRDFVALCLEKERETGAPVLIVASY